MHNLILTVKQEDIDMEYITFENKENGIVEVKTSAIQQMEHYTRTDAKGTVYEGLKVSITKKPTCVSGKGIGYWNNRTHYVMQFVGTPVIEFSNKSKVL